MSKIKGTRAERELFHMFWDNGWGCVRAAGSGSTPLPAPDLLAGNGHRKLAVECKATAEARQYLTQKEVKELVEFSKIFGAEPWVAVRFDRQEWIFVNPEDLDMADTNYVISGDLAKRKGLSFKDLTGS